MSFSMWAITDVSAAAISSIKDKDDRASLHGRNGYVPQAVNLCVSY